MRVLLDVAHHFGEGVPFHLGECEKNVFGREQGVVAPACFFEGAVDDVLRVFGDLAWRDVEVFYLPVYLRLDQK